MRCNYKFEQRVQGLQNIRNLSSKENLQFEFKGDICTKLCLKLWFKSESGWL